MDSQDRLAARFEPHRSHLQAVAYRMLGSASEAEDAVQETWLRFTGADTAGIHNLGGWLTTVIGRVCLNMLRSRRTRRETVPGSPTAVEAAIGSPSTMNEPEDEAVLVESVGRALLVVLDRLGPAERIAFVLHDMFAVPFDDIAPIVDRTVAATKKLASRARHRVDGDGPQPGTASSAAQVRRPGRTNQTDHADRARERRVVEAFLAASRHGDHDRQLADLAPDMVRRADAVALPAGAPVEVKGAQAVAEEAVTNFRLARFAAPALVDGAVGAVVAPRGRLQLVLRLSVDGGQVTYMEVIADPARLAQVELAVAVPVRS
jgi:RNA polymerase sigma factor (sigma-70 family)